MAVLQQPVNNSNPFADVIGDALAAPGTYVATILDIRDEFGVQRQKYQSMEMETVDLTTFLFGYRDAQGYEHRVSSRRMRISGNEKSTLFAFLKSLLGRAPQYGWDYLELRGRQCLLTVEHVQRRDGTGVFAAIAALSPVPAGFGGQPGGQVPQPQAVGPVADHRSAATTAMPAAGFGQGPAQSFGPNADQRSAATTAGPGDAAHRAATTAGMPGPVQGAGLPDPIPF